MRCCSATSTTSSRRRQVRLISESRGRVARLQRWPDGLHAAVEAKEGLAASETGEILDSITIESLVRRYPTVCGMTGTAVAVGEQLREFYGLEVAVIPPNRPCIRDDEPDRLYATVEAEGRSGHRQVAAAHADRAAGPDRHPGRRRVRTARRRSSTAPGCGASCSTPRTTPQEAAIVAEAGADGAITVSTQMAGRGTDIRLGGSRGDRDEIAGLGGLYVIGTGRHASSRLDHQLRGRAGRQGDPGGSVFFASMEDELITQYAPDTAPPDEVDDDGLVTDAGAYWALGHAQRVAEGVNLEIHRNTWRYNKLIEEQRRIVLDHRDRVLRTDAALTGARPALPGAARRSCAETLDDDVLAEAARQIALYHLDRGWAEHLADLADLREGIHLRALGRGTRPAGRVPQGRGGPASTACSTRPRQQSAETFETAAITADGADLERGRPQAAQRHLDLPGAGQPVRHRHRPGPAQRRPPARPPPPRQLRAASPGRHRPTWSMCHRLPHGVGDVPSTTEERRPGAGSAKPAAIS